MTPPPDGPRTRRWLGPLEILGRTSWLSIIWIAIAAVAVRLPDISGRSLWLDELAQVHAARSPLPALVQAVRGHAAAAPLDYIGTKLSIATFGRISPDVTLAARIWPLFCGVATTVAAWHATQELTQSRRAATAAGLMTALSGFLVFYSQEARPYSMAALMAVVCIWTFARATRQDRLLDWLVLAIVAVAAVYTHYFLGLLLLAEGVALVAVRSTRFIRGQEPRTLASVRPIAIFALIGLMTVAAFSPWLLFASVGQLAAPYGYPPIEALSPERLARAAAILLAAAPGGDPSQDLWTDWWLTAGILVVAVIGAVRIIRRRPEPGLALVGFTVSLIPIVWFFDTRSQYFVAERQFIFLVPLVYILAGSGIDGLLRFAASRFPDDQVAWRDRSVRVGQVALATALIVASIAPLGRVYAGELVPKEDWRAAAALTASHLCPDGQVYSNVGVDSYSGVSLYAPQLGPRVVPLHRDSNSEYLLDTIAGYPITRRDVIVILVPVSGVFIPGRGGIDNIAKAMKVQGFTSTSLSGDRIRVLYSPGGCAT